MVWEDLVDDSTRQSFSSFTACELENKTRQLVDDRLPIYREIINAIRGQVTDPELLQQCIAALQDHAGRDPCNKTAMDTYYVGGERGQRVGEQRAKRMINEARQYEQGIVKAHAPWLYDDAEGDSD